MKSLDEIGVERGTDKSSLNHHYLELYEMLFEPYRNDYIRLLEVGVQFGNSMRTWRDFFPHGSIVGIDSIDNGVQFKPMEGIQVIIGDAYSDEIFDRIIGKFDIIIDDASHDANDQYWFVKKYSDFLTEDGILIVEDVLDPDVIPLLERALPNDFRSLAVDMTKGDSQVDSRLFIAKRKAYSSAVHIKSVTL